MTARNRTSTPLGRWPALDQRLWQKASTKGDFLDPDGNEIEHSDDEHDDHDDHGDEHDDDGDGLVVSENDATIAIVEVEGHDEEDGDDHEDEHGNALHIEGVSAGTTSFKLVLMHDGHADYTAPNNVPITLN